MLRSSTHMILWLALSLVPLACDNDGAGGDPAPSDTTADTIAPQDTTEDAATDLIAPEDTPPPPEDTLQDTPPPPPDTFEDTPPPPDTNPDVPCEIPSYSDDCAEVPYFQCGFMAWCEDGVLYADWHEHVFCDGEELIVDMACEHACPGGCKEGDIIDWPATGADYVAEYCEKAPDCDIPPLYASVTLVELLADPDPWDGLPVGFEGHVLMGAPICTLAECPPLDPCCNDCNANFEITGPAGAIGLVGGAIPQVGCSGDNCTFMDNCKPFPVVPADYILWGTLESAWGPTLYLDGWCPAQ